MMKRKTKFLLAVLLFLIVRFLPLPGLSREAHTLLAILSLVIPLWISEAIPLGIGGMLGVSLAVILGACSAKEAFTGFSNSIFFLLIGGLLLARGLETSRLHERLAFGLLSAPSASASVSRVLFVYGLSTWFLSCFLSNTASTALMLPLGLGLLSILCTAEGLNEKTVYPAFLLFTAFAASLGGLATPIGTAPNLVGIAYVEQISKQSVTFPHWMKFGVPIALLSVFATGKFLVFRYRLSNQSLSATAAYVQEQKKSLGAMSRGEKNVFFVLCLAAMLWLLPSAASLLLGEDAAAAKLLSDHLEEGVVAIFSACMLFILPKDSEGNPVLEAKDVSLIEWDVMLLFGCGITLGTLMKTTGLSDVVGKGLTKVVGGAPPLFLVLLLSTGVSIVLSELTSNTASVTIVVPLVISLCSALKVSPIPAILSSTIGASFGFMLPISTPPNALVYATGRLPLREMIRSGILLDLFGFFLVPVMIWLLV